MSIYFQPTALVGAIAIAMGLSTTVSANANTETLPKESIQTSLDTIVVTATRSEEKIENVPARISIIEPKILEQSSITSFPQILKNDASINMVQSGGFGQQSSIFLRGTESDHTLVMRDGVRLNTTTSSAASLPFIDTTDVEQIEILKGPASVLYGTDAIGGVVHIITKTPQKSGAFLTGEIGENKTYKSSIGADFAENGIYAQIRGQRLESDGTPILNNQKRNYSYDQKGYSAKLGVEKDNYSASIDYSTNEGLNEFNKYGSLEVTDFRNEIVNLKGSVKFANQFELNARLSQFKDAADYLVSPSYIHSISSEAELFGKWNFTTSQNILLGTTQRKLEAKTSTLNEEIDSAGYYIQHQLNTDKLHTQVGLRVEDNEKFGTHTVAQGAVRYDFSPITSVYTNIGTAFKAPTLNDLYANWGGNPDLKPEESISYEIGIDQKLPFNILVGASTFYTEIDNLITSKCISNCPSWSSSDWKNINIDQASILGAELYAKWKLEDYFISTNYQYAKSKDEQTNDDLLRRPRHSLTVSAGIQNDVYGLSTSIIAKSKAKDFADDENDPLTNLPGYATVDFNAYWNVNPNIKLFTNIENMGDVKFKTAYNGSNTYYINGGRQASVGVTFKY